MAYEKGQPSIAPGSQQLPQGGATQANASVPTPDPGMAMPDLPVIYAPREEDPIDNDDSKLSENMQILAAPPDPNWAPNPMKPMRKVPQYVVRNLPLLMVAARDPEAPRAIKAMYRVAVAALEKQERERA